MTQTEWYAEHFACRHSARPRPECGICSCLVAGRDLTTILLPGPAAGIAAQERAW